MFLIIKNALSGAAKEVCITNSLYTDFVKGDRIHLILKIIQKYSYDEISKFIFPPELSNIETSLYEYTGLELEHSEKVFQLIIQDYIEEGDNINPDYTICDKFNEGISIESYNEEFQLRYDYILKPTFKDLLQIELSDKVNCSDDEGVKCKLIALIRRSIDHQIENQLINCDKQRHHCIINTKYRNNTQIENRFFDIYTEDQIWATVIINDENGGYSLWDP
ncbi:uncharacterized protein LOC126900331 isoform X2 [Daktulosphaira vitifoliae]|uniref:uncharacterized protein LOC126900331 isoform X2 n=1 Tax=Daktulosphaira vitifoliae TaxID=58002 RepID=UPI0021A99761|nr:uncharacterized protein LOC126900331 isoform X2 [Daktulosphaira vitifoliae]